MTVGSGLDRISDAQPSTFTLQPAPMRCASVFILSALLLSACAGSQPASDTGGDGMMDDPAPPQALGQAVEQVDGGLRFPVEAGTMRVMFCGDALARVTVAPTDTLSERPSMTVTGCDDAADGVRTLRRGDSLIVETDSASITVDRRSGALTVQSASGKRLVEALAPRADDFTPVDVTDGPAWQVRQRFALTPDEGIYGLGQYQDGVLNWRGEDVLMAQANTMAAIPFMLSTRGYGILWDQTSGSRFHDQDGTTWLQADVADQIDYYVATGEEPKDAVAGYRRLTGKAPMFAKWAYGYWQSTERYRSGDELISVAEEYRERDIPIDNLVQDWYYWPSPEYFSGMVWDSTRYPHPARTIETLHDEYDMQLMISVWPAVGIESEIYDELKSEDLLYQLPHWSPARVYDAYSEKARDIFWKYLKDAFFDEGVDAWWTDGAEPEFQSTDDRYITRRSLLQNEANARGSQARFLNTFSLAHTGGLARHLREAAPGERPFMLARAAFAGQQRHSTTLWTGDIWASWQTLEDQIAAGLNVNMAGMPYWTTDIGAFIVEPRFPQGTDDPAYRELYTRWFQFGVVSPIFRAHGTQIPREIWQFGEPGDPAYDAMVRADRLRYRLMPYIYSTAWDVYDSNAPFLRALPYAFPDDPEGYDEAGTFLFGESLLASPVTKAMQHPPEQIQEFIPTNRILNPEGTAPGMEQQFFYGTDLERPAVTRKSEIFNLTWKGSLPPAMADSTYSLRYDGQIQTERAGEYTFVLTTDSGTRLRIDGETVLDQWTRQGTGEETGTEDPWDQGTPRTERVTLELPAGTRVPIRLDYRQPTPNAANLVLEWITPTREEQTIADTQTWPTYLPAGTDWINFWTGERAQGGQVNTMDAPLDRLPLYAKAGAILPMGPVMEHTGAQPADPLEIRVYPGADGSFTLFEDAGDGMGYKEGEDYATIPFTWDDDAGALTIGEREGSFEGMLEERTLRIVWVGPDHGVGVETTPEADRVVTYDGTAQTVQR
jgi:alpha-D-xyloside xylohydrolase